MTITNSGTSVALADYLFDRIAQLGIQNIFGVPGDFNLVLLDHVVSNPNLHWMGFCNELNAAYAADGFSRAKDIPGVLITTYGVGELSALNGVSGAFAEVVPMIHIVGTTSRPAIHGNWLLHHTRPDGTLNPVDHKGFMETSKPYSCAHEFLEDPKTAAEQIDRVLSQVYKKSLPGYIYIPTDMVKKEILGAGQRLLDIPLDLTVVSAPSVTEETESQIADEILSLIYAAENPVFVVDCLAERFHLRHQLKELITKSHIWTFTTPLGKATIDETLPEYSGVYIGKAGLEGSYQAVGQDSDLVIRFGPLFSDANTGGFTDEIAHDKHIILHSLYVSIKGKQYTGVHFVPVVNKIVEKFDPSKLTFIASSENKPKIKAFQDPPSVDITQTQLVSSFSKFIQPNDTFLVECGCFQYNAAFVNLPENVKYWTQIFYSCIGYTLPAALGAAVAKKELGAPGRVVLVEGDGSSQMTIQELGTMVRNRLPIIIFLLNNSGYSIERAIWGAEQEYNDICPNWKWTELLTAFGGTEETCESFKVTNRKEFDDILASKELQNPTKTILVEVILDKFDYSDALNKQIKVMGKKNIAAANEFATAKGEK